MYEGVGVVVVLGVRGMGVVVIFEGCLISFGKVQPINKEFVKNLRGCG